MSHELKTRKPSKHTKRSLLLDVPGEIQDLIFEFLIEDEFTRLRHQRGCEHCSELQHEIRELDYSRGAWISSAALQRTQALSALSQTCRAFHKRFDGLVSHGMCLKINARPKSYDRLLEKKHQRDGADCVPRDAAGQGKEKIHNVGLAAVGAIDTSARTANDATRIYQAARAAQQYCHDCEQEQRVGKHDLKCLSVFPVESLQRLWLDMIINESLELDFEEVMFGLKFGKHLKIFFLILSAGHHSKTKVLTEARMAERAQQPTNTLTTTQPAAHGVRGGPPHLQPVPLMALLAAAPTDPATPVTGNAQQAQQ
ncbi:Hypothetical protein D9617_27g045380 [Elsinoe fawcettii]|nr:Hypothetical protein D9617_27g045380 [Elsinoe fawcettii]